jgi:DNA (cytosine-5)-methyltransferase 1
MDYYNEFDPQAARWLQSLIDAGEIPAGHIDTRSIADVAATDLVGYRQCHFFAGIGGWPLAFRMAGWPDTDPVWSGSCPCQPYSDAGPQTGDADPRNLWPHLRRLIAERKPAKVFGEQVASKAARAWLAAVRDDLERMGFAVGAANLCAAGVGAPQIRQRIFWVADANYPGREGAERSGQPDQAREAREAARRQPVRSDRGPWPPGPGEVHRIPQLANGLPGVLGACKGYGNAIVPQVAAAFIESVMESS